MSDEKLRAAVIPLSSEEGDKTAALVGRGLALEFIDWLKLAKVDCVLLTSTHVDDDGRQRSLVNFSEELDTQTVSDIVSMAQEEQADGDDESTEVPNIQIVFSGYLKRVGETFDVSFHVTDAAGAYPRGSAQAHITAGQFGNEVASLFTESAKLAGLNTSTKYSPGTARLAAWNQLMVARALRLAGEVGALSNDLPDVFDPAIKAARLDRNCTAARDRLCELAEVLVFERGYDPQKALHALDDVTRLVGVSWRSVQVRGQLLEALGKHAEAAKHFLRLLKGAHEAPTPELVGRAAFAASRAYNQCGKHEEAERLAARAMKVEELKVEAIIESGAANLGQGKKLVAERLWQRALELEPEHIGAHLRLAHYYASHDDVKQAGEQFARVTAIEGVPREVYADAAEFYYNHRLFDDAIMTARRFAEEFPGEPIAHLLCASAHNALGRHDEARKELDLADLCAGVGALKDLAVRQRRWCESPSSESRLHAAAERVFGEDPASVADELAALIKEYPDFWEARMLLGIALRRMEKWNEAKEQFEEIIKERSVPAADKELTGIYSQLGDLAKALEFAKRAYDAQPDDPEIIANYAAALLENDELTEAYKFARRAESMAPADEVTRTLIQQILARSESRGFLANIKAAAKFVTKKLRRKKK